MLKDLTKELFIVRKSLEKLVEDFELKSAPYKERKDELQKEILKELNESGQFSARFDDVTVTRAVRKTLQVTDEQKLIKDLKKKGLSEYISERPNELFETAKKEAVKSGMTFAGTEIKETEYISLTQAQKEERRKVTTE